MDFSSNSSDGRHYRNGHHGSSYYQKKGILGSLLNLFSSKDKCQQDYNNYGNYHNNAPINDQPLVNHSALICSKCNSQIPAGSKFCLQCGEKVNDALFCMNCGEKLPANAKYCLKCGNKIY